MMGVSGVLNRIQELQGHLGLTPVNPAPGTTGTTSTTGTGTTAAGGSTFASALASATGQAGTAMRLPVTFTGMVTAFPGYTTCAASQDFRIPVEKQLPLQSWPATSASCGVWFVSLGCGLTSPDTSL